MSGLDPVRDPLWFGFGLRIRSEIALPGAPPCPYPHILAAADRDEGFPAIGDADIDIVYGATPCWTARRAWEVYRVASADLFEIAVPGLARFTCLDRRRIVVDPLPGTDAARLAELLVATILPALLWARGRIVLHATAFILSGGSRGIAIAGASGSGKSTALARALAMGAHGIADDSLCIRIGREGAVASGLAGGYFERDGAARTFRAVAASRQRLACPLGVLVVLAPDATAPRRLTGIAAIEALLRHRHRPRIAALLGTEAAMVPGIAAIAHALAVVAVPVPGPWPEQMILHDAQFPC